MPTDPAVDDVLDIVAKRIEVLTLLDGDRVPKRTITDELGISRSTVNRAIADLAEAGLVDDAPSGCQATFVGSVLAKQYGEYVETASTVLASREVLTALPPEAELSPKVLSDADVSTPGGSSPYEPYRDFEGLLSRAVGQVRVYVPTFTNPRGIELAQKLSRNVPVELVFDGTLFGELCADIPEEIETLFELEEFTGYETTTGPVYTIALVETETGTEGAIVVHSADRELVGTVVTSDPEAIQWMERRYSEIRTDSERPDTLP